MPPVTRHERFFMVDGSPNVKTERMTLREVRANYNDQTLRVYQAFSPEIAERALEAQTFKPPFKQSRMTWIKPSFTWMMYRSGWAAKRGQERILGIDIQREGFEWALGHSCLTAFDETLHGSHEAWKLMLRTSPVRIQWDPERTLTLAPLSWRTIQVGLGAEVVPTYVGEWIVRILDVTALAKEVKALVGNGSITTATNLIPKEITYPLPHVLAHGIGCS